MYSFRRSSYSHPEPFSTGLVLVVGFVAFVVDRGVVTCELLDVL